MKSLNLLIPLLLLSSCSTTEKIPEWAVPTEYAVDDIDAGTRLSLLDRLDRNFGDLGIEVLPSTEVDLLFRVQNIPDMDQLRDLQKTIQDHSQTKNVPVKLQAATFLFSSLAGQGETAMSVRHQVTPGSRVRVDVGSTVLEPLVDDEGGWSVAVPRSASLSARKGDIFVEVVKGNVVLFQRANVLSEDGFVNIPAAELPADSGLRE